MRDSVASAIRLAPALMLLGVGDWAMEVPRKPFALTFLVIATAASLTLLAYLAALETRIVILKWRLDRPYRRRKP
jgi:hypothetical protein